MNKIDKCIGERGIITHFDANVGCVLDAVLNSNRLPNVPNFQMFVISSGEYLLSTSYSYFFHNLWKPKQVKRNVCPNSSMKQIKR